MMSLRNGSAWRIRIGVEVQLCLQAELEVSKHESSTKCRQPRALLTELGEENSKLASETWSNMEFGSKDHGPSLNGNFADCALLQKAQPRTSPRWRGASRIPL